MSHKVQTATLEERVTITERVQATSFQSARLDKITELLETAGEFELAEQLGVESAVCGE